AKSAFTVKAYYKNSLIRAQHYFNRELNIPRAPVPPRKAHDKESMLQKQSGPQTAIIVCEKHEDKFREHKRDGTAQNLFQAISQ
ncbi:hypothetical protein J6590_066189, partial [Homalodisca vitripennis]